MTSLIIVFTAIGGSMGVLIIGSLFQTRGADAFYVLLVPVVLLSAALAVFRHRAVPKQIGPLEVPVRQRPDTAGTAPGHVRDFRTERR